MGADPGWVPPVAGGSGGSSPRASTGQAEPDIHAPVDGLHGRGRFGERGAAAAAAYWVPLTVAIVLKPDYGSVFARALQRGIGTVVGGGRGGGAAGAGARDVAADPA